ncbi:hypothetical protein V1460_07825 [Streptomyces sp. SCSIO 30461]|uniref:tetratricopeptide repeat protein n=1 Tax=Streptomyces sp. SCSIO 30461 TaxID=3118085 RepID=UPI0030CC7C4D
MCERWADEHAGDPEEPRALVDAGWLTVRHGEAEGALSLFRRAAACDGEYRLDAHVGIVDQLYALGRATEAEHTQEDLRAHLDTCHDRVPALRCGRPIFCSMTPAHG